MTARQIASEIGATLEQVRFSITHNRGKHGTEFFRISGYKRESKNSGVRSAIYSLGPGKDCDKSVMRKDPTLKPVRSFEKVKKLITDLLIAAPGMSRKEIDTFLGHRTSERLLTRMHGLRLVHISAYREKKGFTKAVELFSAGDGVDAIRPVTAKQVAEKKAAIEAKKPKPVPMPSNPKNRLIFVCDSVALEDAKYRKQYKPAPQRVHVSWLGAV